MNQKGFTLVELSIVLVVIGLLISISSVAGNIQRNAEYTKIQSRFVMPWAQTYKIYFDYVGLVPGDITPATGKINQGNGDICDADLRKFFNDAGIELPTGRGASREDKAVFNALDNNPRQIAVCLSHVQQWRIQGSEIAVNAIRINGLTPDLATKLDTAIDGLSNASDGMFRVITGANADADWPVANDTNLQSVDAYYRMPF